MFFLTNVLSYILILIMVAMLTISMYLSAMGAAAIAFGYGVTEPVGSAKFWLDRIVWMVACKMMAFLFIIIAATYLMM